MIIKHVVGSSFAEFILENFLPQLIQFIGLNLLKSLLHCRWLGLVVQQSITLWHKFGLQLFGAKFDHL